MIRFGRTIWYTAMSVVAILSTGATALAVPVVPNFTQGSMTSRTETNSTVTETINSIDYRTGWEYTVTGVGVDNNGSPLNPPVNTSTVTVTAAPTTASPPAACILARDERAVQPPDERPTRPRNRTGCSLFAITAAGSDAMMLP